MREMYIKKKGHGVFVYFFFEINFGGAVDRLQIPSGRQDTAQEMSCYGYNITRTLSVPECLALSQDFAVGHGIPSFGIWYQKLSNMVVDTLDRLRVLYKVSFERGVGLFCQWDTMGFKFFWNR